jgi:hypothetical protein
VLSVPSLPSDSPLLRNREGLVSRAIGSGSAFLSEVSADPILPEPHASIETPVFLDGRPVYEIAMILSLGQFRDLLQGQNFAPTWLSGIVDRNGAFVARIPSELGRPGTLASREFRDAARRPPESTVTHYSIGGQKIVSATMKAVFTAANAVPATIPKPGAIRTLDSLLPRANYLARIRNPCYIFQFSEPNPRLVHRRPGEKG